MCGGRLTRTAEEWTYHQEEELVDEEGADNRTERNKHDPHPRLRESTFAAVFDIAVVEMQLI